MSKIINFPTIQDDETDALYFERTVKFYEASQAISDYMGTLTMRAEQYEQLTTVLLTLIHEASQGAYLQGFELGMGMSLEPLENE
jgi:hypothetical protein